MRTCLRCGAPLNKRPKDSFEQAQNRTYCSKECVYEKQRATWTPEEAAYLQEHYPAGTPMYKLRAFLGKEPRVIRSKAAKLGLLRPENEMKEGPVTQDDLKRIQQKAPDLLPFFVAELERLRAA